MTLLDDGPAPAETDVASRQTEVVPGPSLSRRIALRLWPLPAAVASGLLLYLAFPPIGLWWLAPVGVALFALTTYRRSFWTGLGLGFVTGLSVLIPVLHWAGGFVGSVWLFLPFGESVYFALLGGLSALATPLLLRWRWTWPLMTGTLWVLQEAARDRTPFGGFPWARLAFSQDNSPLLGLASLGGAPLVTFAVAVCGGLLAYAVLVILDSRGKSAQTWLKPVVIAMVVGIVITAAPMATLPKAGVGPTMRIAVVQGNVPRLGLEFNAQRRAVLDNHANATFDLAKRVSDGVTPRPDLVVWPENSSDIDPIENADAATEIMAASRAVGAPILVGELRDGPGPTDVRNVGQLWTASGPGDSYTKQHPVPFAEYIPMRSFVRTYITKQVDLVKRDFVAGTSPGLLKVGPATLGDVICFEVAYDDIVRTEVAQGANVIVVQTNNATFNEAEALQQLAMVRLRAVEHGREALMASTVGVSAFVDAHGNVYDATQFNAEAVIERTVYLGSGTTMATRLGVAPELVLASGAVILLIVALLQRRRLVAA